MSRFEASVQAIGNDLLNAMPTGGPSVFKKDFWQGKVMDWSMKDEAFKIEMFRFVDVFPVLDTPEAVARHTKEYFCRPGQDFPAWIQLGMKSVSSSSFIAKTAAGQIEKNMRSMARQFIAGEDAEDALPTLKSIWDAGRCFTVDLLGEATISDSEGAAYTKRCLELIDGLAKHTASWPRDERREKDHRGVVPRVNVSVKPSSLYSQLDPVDTDRSAQRLCELLLPIVKRAHASEVFINLDVEDYPLKSITLAAFKLLATHPEVKRPDWLGIVIQAYLRDALNDTKELVKWAKKNKALVTVRLVKGAYWDYETIRAQQHGWKIPVFQQKAETDRSYEQCLDVLLDYHKYIRTAVASHNVRSLAVAIALADKYKLKPGELEIQMLYGMADPLKTSVQSRGFRVREYVPIGELVPGMAYLVRRLLENTSNEGFLRAKFVDNVDTRTLLAEPTSSFAPDPSPETLFRNTPAADFTSEGMRASMRAGFVKARKLQAQSWPGVIGDERISTDTTIASTNPAVPSEEIGRVACLGPDMAGKAMQAAADAFPAWRDLPVRQRANIAYRLADRMNERCWELSALIVLESGKNWREADADVGEAMDFCRFYADEAIRLMENKHKLGSTPGERNMLWYTPLGAGVVIAPWNFPLAILTGMAIGPLVAGNTVVMKAAEQTPIIAGVLFDLMRTAGVPAGVANFVPGYGDVGAALVRDKRTRFIAFTGSRAVGLDILKAAHAEPAAAGLKRVVCEMGGKNAIIVDDDADLDDAVLAVIHSTFAFQGQKCSACSRAIVVGNIYDVFVSRLADAIRSLEIGNPEDPRFRYGPVIDAESATRIREAIAVAKSEGTLIVETETLPGPCYVPFVVVGDIRPEHRTAQEEVFGPLLAVMRATDFDDALRIANSTEYALTGAVISRSPTHLAKAEIEFEVGNLYINRGCTGALVYRQPFGGYAFSGTGPKAGGPGYLKAFLHERSVSENTVRRGFAPDA